MATRWHYGRQLSMDQSLNPAVYIGQGAGINGQACTTFISAGGIPKEALHLWKQYLLLGLPLIKARMELREPRAQRKASGDRRVWEDIKAPEVRVC